jgi:hypothetical protein
VNLITAFPEPLNATWKDEHGNNIHGRAIAVGRFPEHEGGAQETWFLVVQTICTGDVMIPCDPMPPDWKKIEHVKVAM